jgi:hypothetical protein
MKKISIGLVICLVAIGCENAKPPVAPPVSGTPAMDMSKMHGNSAPQPGAHAAPADAHAAPAGEAPAEGDAKTAEPPK